MSLLTKLRAWAMPGKNTAEMHNPLLDPDIEPGTMDHRMGTRRLSQKIIFGFFALVIVALAILAMKAASISKAQTDAQNTKPVIVKDNNSGSDTAAEAASVIAGATAPAVSGASQTPGDVKIALPPGTPPQATPEQIAAQQQIAQQEMQQQQQSTHAAMTASTSVPFTIGTSSTNNQSTTTSNSSTRQDTLNKIALLQEKINAAQANQDPTQAYLAQIKAIKEGGILPATPPPGETSDKQLSVNAVHTPESKKDSRWALGNVQHKLTTPYELRAGFVLPAIMVTGINSELPGQILAQVSQNVYDSATGRFLLIPQGARLVGSYSNAVLYGQSRVLVVWERIDFPDGRTLDLGGMPGSDEKGYAGFQDQVDNHYLKIFGSAILMSGVIAAASYSQQQPTTTPYAVPTAGSTLSMALGQELGQTTSQMIAKNLNIAPTLKIRQGYRLNVVVVKDLVFTQPYNATF